MPDANLFDSVFMYKVLVLQELHGLTDTSVEEQVGNRLSFMNFLWLRPGDAIPDANSIWDLREAL
jgi:IS5 family transposase